jgi:hypothetical protein
MRCCAVLIVFLVGVCRADAQDRPAPLRVGFGAADITPPLTGKSVYLAGFGKNRIAKEVHDPLMARAVVLHDGTRKLALVSVDLVGLFHHFVERVRKGAAGFDYVLVSSTHNHEGPDTLGLWGPNFFQSGVDPAYMKLVEAGILDAIAQADRKLQAAEATIGVAAGPELLHDGREPQVKHDELVALQFTDRQKRPIGIVVQWNCHPETLSSKNTAVSADYVAATVADLEERHRCPVVYLTGTVGGLMTSLNVKVMDDQGKPLADGTFEKTRRYGKLVARLADKAIDRAKPAALTPLLVQRREIYLPIDNQGYLLGWTLGVLERDSYRWTGDVAKAEPAAGNEKVRKCLKTEIARLRLGDLDVACIPGEIYPELVLGKVQDPPDKGADYPDAAAESSIYGQLQGPHRMLIGLANDEIGYIIPKRQWDEKAPFCYGRKRSQYGEVNSLGPETAPLLCEAFRELVTK